MNKQIMLISLLTFCILPLMADDDIETFGKSFFFPRSQGTNSLSDVNNLAHFQYPFARPDELHGYYGWSLEYQRSYNEEDLAKYMFFNNTDTMKFGNIGTGIDVFARNFILNDDFEGSVTAHPRIESIIMDQLFQLNLGGDHENIYMTLNAPIAWTKFDMQLEETITSSGTDIPLNILGNPANEPSPYSSIIQAWKGNLQLQGFYPDLKRPLEFAKINGPQTTGSLVQLEYALGYYFVTKPDAHFGMEARIVIPTGNRPKGEFVFEPLAGNGHHTQLGIGFQGHLNVVDYGGLDFAVYGVAHFYHLFNAKQHRTFDLKLNGIGSRYLLLKKFNPDGTYAGEIEFGPNILTLACKTKVPLLMDGSIIAVYDFGNTTLVAGYTCWARTAETVSITESIPHNTYGVQGNTPTAGANTNTTASATRINGQFADTFDQAPQFLNLNNVNTRSASPPAAYSNRISAHVAYNWEQHPFDPYLLLGGFLEMSGAGNQAMSQWGMFTQFGLSIQ